MNPDIISTYFPALEDIPESDVLDARQRAELYLRRGWPELDMRPASPFGDWNLTPFAYLLAGLEVALGRFRSDLDLENVSKGVIYDCTFVTKFLKNFAVQERTTAMSSGVIRLTFNADKDFTIDRRARYQFGDGNTFSLRMPYQGPFLIRPVGTPLAEGVNTRSLVDMGSGLFSVDLPVTGVMASPVTSGTAGSTDFTISELQSAVALVDFDAGADPVSLPVLAAKTRETAYSATPTTRGGCRHFLRKEFPDLSGASPVLSGDPEMIRDSLNAIGIRDGSIDVYVRGKNFVKETQVVTIPYAQRTQDVQKFVGKLSLLHPPYFIDSIVAVDAPTLSLDDKQGSLTILSRSLDQARAPMASAAYTMLEELWAVISMPTDPTSGANLIAPDIAEDGSESARFIITYRYDPMVRIVSDTMSSLDVKPVGVNILVRGFIPVVLSNLTVSYTRDPGTTVRLDTAASEILSYVNGLSYPNLYADARIYDSMFYNGASDTRSIDCNASVQWSVAQLFLLPDAPLPSQDLAGAMAKTVAPRAIAITSSRYFKPTYVDLNLGTPNASFEVIGPKNVTLLLDATNLSFSEVTV